MKGYFSLYFFWLCTFLLPHQIIIAKDPDDPQKKFFYSQELVDKGEVEEAIVVLLDLLKDSTRYPKRNLALVYFNLGVYSEWAGRYDESLYFFNQQERLLSAFDAGVIKISNNYNGKASVYVKLGDFDKALQFYEAGIRLVKSSGEKNKETDAQLSKLYLNLGILLVYSERWKEALEYLLLSKKIKEVNGFTHLAGVYLNLGRVYSQFKEDEKADWYFQQSIKYWAKEFGPEYWQMGASYEKYGIFLMNTGRLEEAESYLLKALSFYQERFKRKTENIGWVYKNLGDLYFRMNLIEKSVLSYQNALIQSVEDFSCLDPEDNPPLKVRIVNSSILSILIAKSKAIRTLGQQTENREERLKKLRVAYQTIQSADQYFKQLVNIYSGTEGRLILASEFKSLFLLGTDLALELYEEEGDPDKLKESYLFASAWKSAELMRHIQLTETFEKMGEKDSLVAKIGQQRKSLERLSNRIRALEEAENRNPIEITATEEELFLETRILDSLLSMAKGKESYRFLLNYNPSIDLYELKSSLNQDQVIVEYLIGNQESGTGEKIFLFVINHDGLNYKILDNGKEIDRRVRWYVEHLRSYRPGTFNRDLFDTLTNTMHSLYSDLFKPVENLVRMKNVILIPDEDMYYLPFESFIRNKPESDLIDFSSLDYLLKHYSFSVSYSVTFWLRNSETIKRRPEIIALAPEVRPDSKDNKSGLPGTGIELEYLVKNFKGRFVIGDNVTPDYFQSAIKERGSILHIAAHAEQGKDREGGYIILGRDSPDSSRSRLYEYEISTMEIRSGLVNLSACNTGSGHLSYGEGIFSLGRSFMQAGVPTIVYTLWEVNDQRSSVLIWNFYRNLLDGESLDFSLQNAKLDYLESSPAYLSHPYFWAGYQLAGNVSPFRRSVSLNFWIYLIAGTIFLAGTGYFIFRRAERISKASS